MHIDNAVAAVESLQWALRSSAPELSFTFELCGYREPLHSCFRTEIPAPGAGRKSGVYFVTDDNGEILYIGKATAQNLAAEICGKFGAPIIVDKAADVPRFENSSLAKWASEPALRALVASGDVLVSALVIEPSAIASMVEVYLHTRCQLGVDRALPRLNKRIG
jgi:hypothetical protein